MNAHELRIYHVAEGRIDDWDRFHADPRWQAGLRARRGETSLVRGVESTALRPVEPRSGES